MVAGQSLKNCRGALQIPLLFAFLILGTGYLGTWGILRKWRNLTELQLRLDRCAGETSLELMRTMNAILTGNQRITYLRTAMVAALPSPELAVPLRAALSFTVARQDLERAHWDIIRTRWQVRARCGDLADRPLPLPSLRWTRKPPDTLGPQPLEWLGKMPEEFHIEIGHSPRHAAASVVRSERLLKGKSSAEKWQAKWATPRGALGTNFR